MDYPALVQGARANGVALELNNSSLRKPWLRPNCIENYKTMLPLCARLGVPVIVNSDAHDPGAAGDFQLAYRMLETLDFPEELIINNDLAKVKSFLLDV